MKTATEKTSSGWECRGSERRLMPAIFASKIKSRLLAKMTIAPLVFSLLFVANAGAADFHYEVPTTLRSEELARFESQRLAVGGTRWNWVAHRGAGNMVTESEFYRTAGYDDLATKSATMGRIRKAANFGIFPAAMLTAWPIAFFLVGDFFAPGLLLGSGALGIALAAVSITAGERSNGTMYPMTVAESIADEYNRWLIREIRAGRM